MTEVTLRQGYESHNRTIANIPRVGERVKIYNYNNEIVIDGIVTAVEYTYHSKYNSIEVRVG